MLTINTSTTSNTKDNFPDSLYSHSIIILLGYSNYKKDSINKFDGIVKTNERQIDTLNIWHMLPTWLPHMLSLHSHISALGWTKHALWRSVVTMKYGEEWGGWSTKLSQGTNGCDLWKSIKMGWVGSYNTPILMLALVVKSSYGMTTGVEISLCKWVFCLVWFLIAPKIEKHQWSPCWCNEQKGR